MKDASHQVSPHSVEAEQQLLGAILTNNDHFHKVSGVLRQEHFYEPVHQRIWGICETRIAKDHLVSPITMKEDMLSDEGLAELGGPAYLVRLASGAISGFAIKDYARVITEAAEKRRVLEHVRNVEYQLTHGGDLGASISEIEMMLHETEDMHDAPRSMSFLTAQMESIKELQEISEGKVVSAPTGLKSLDDAVSLKSKRYTMLGACTSMGKSALGLSIAYSAAQAGFGVGFVSLEMPETDVVNRINSSHSMIPYKAMDRPLSENSFRQVVESAKALQTLPVQIFSERVRDIPAILSEGKRLMHHMRPNGPFKGFKLLVIDYIQLVRGRGESSFVRLSQVANDLKQVAKMLDVHVLALAQVDRKISASDDHAAARPKLADLRGSGDLENAPDNVIFVHRPEYYLKRQNPPKKTEDRADWEADCERWKGKAEIIVAKARMGEISTITVGCDMGTNRFYDLEDQQGDIEF